MTGAEREPDALVEVRERLAALLPEAGFPTLLDEATAVVGDALWQARAEETARADAAEARVAAGLALADRLDREADLICARDHYDKADKAWRVASAQRRDAAELRAALSPAQGEPGVGVP